MLLNIFKEWLINRKIKNNLFKTKRSTNSNPIKTVGLLIENNYYKEHKIIIDQLQKNGIDPRKVDVLVYKDTIKKTDKIASSSFESKNLNWDGTIGNIEVNFFLEKKFDLLISYYDSDTLILKLATHHSNADFKVGFSSINKQLNDLLINTEGKNQLLFINEVIKYLKILNKI